MSTNDDAGRSTDITVLYNVLCDTARALTGRYIALGRAATTAEEQARWKNKVMDLRDERRQVDPSDREAITEHTHRWAEELRELKHDA